MPIRSSDPDSAVDTSISIPFVVSDHEHHEQVFTTLSRRHLALAGHAAFETYSVLTRLPPPVRLTPSAAEQVVRENFDTTCFLSAERTRELLHSLPSLDIAGGSAYDALVGAAAREHSLVLVTRDHRALPTYRAIGVRYEFVG